MKSLIEQQITAAVKALGLNLDAQSLARIKIDYPESSLGDYSSNAALVLAKPAGLNPHQLAEQIVAKLSRDDFESVDIAGPGFINFRLSSKLLIDSLRLKQQPPAPAKPIRFLVEYFQPNIAKPLHIGHLRTAIIGDALVRMLKYLGHAVESDTHMGDWGTQFGLLILAYKKYGQQHTVAKDPIPELNKLYIRINQEMESDPALHQAGKAEFVKLEQGDPDNRQLWQQFVDWSMQKFLAINDLAGILPFDHHWPESFYEDKMAAVLERLAKAGLLVESQGAKIVNLEGQGLGIAVIVKSDGGTTYLLRDLATFLYRKSLGFERQLYVVDSRQAHVFKQLFAILGLLGEWQPGDAEHIDYGFISFKGEALSTRKGNMVLAEQVLAEAEAKVAQVIAEKNPDLADKAGVVKAVSRGAIKYFDLSHNRHSDIEFDWDEAINFEGNSGPYLQYTHARLQSILRKQPAGGFDEVELAPADRQLLLETVKLPEMVEASIAEYLPNLLANYLYGLAGLANKFYHQSPVLKEPDAKVQAFRLALVKKTADVLKQGLELLGIEAPDEM